MLHCRHASASSSAQRPGSGGGDGRRTSREAARSREARGEVERALRLLLHGSWPSPMPWPCRSRCLAPSGIPSSEASRCGRWHKRARSGAAAPAPATAGAAPVPDLHCDPTVPSTSAWLDPPMSAPDGAAAGLQRPSDAGLLRLPLGAAPASCRPGELAAPSSWVRFLIHSMTPLRLSRPPRGARSSPRYVCILERNTGPACCALLVAVQRAGQHARRINCTSIH